MTEQEYFDDLDASYGVIGEWRECWKCGGEGMSEHDCGEDTCCCFMPEDNVRCDICNGDGGWYLEAA